MSEETQLTRIANSLESIEEMAREQYILAKVKDAREVLTAAGQLAWLNKEKGRINVILATLSSNIKSAKADTYFQARAQIQQAELEIIRIEHEMEWLTYRYPPLKSAV